jgi:peptidoglycan/xylan/chitin deacetylase (PgdA/CDA1 family)
VTFDDGYADTYRNAFPILQRYGIPATIFVTTGNVDGGAPFWFELAAYLMARLEPHTLRLPELNDALPLGATAAKRRDSLRLLHATLKSVPHVRRVGLIGEWSRALAGRLDSSSADIGWPIEWAQITEMASAGIEFGSHTVTHPNLALLGEEELQWELSYSKQRLQEHLQQPVNTLAYPFGTASSYDAQVIRVAKESGFKLGIAYRSGANWTPHLQPFEIRRLGVSLATGTSYFESMLRYPDWLS